MTDEVVERRVADTYGDPSASIYVICDPPTEKCDRRLPTDRGSLETFLREAKTNGFTTQDFYFISLCDPIPENIKKSKAKTWKHVEPNLERVRAALGTEGKPVVTLGDLATRAALGRAAAITKVRGTLLPGKVYPVFSPAYCRAVLEQLPVFKSDMATLRKIHDVNYDIAALAKDNINATYCTDISWLLEAHPSIIAIDTETTGLRQTAPDFEVLTVQIAFGPNDVIICPLHKNFWPTDDYTDEKRNKLLAQIKQLSEDKTIRKVGQNINYEVSTLNTLGITLRGILADTLILAWFIDENMWSKSLDDLVRRFVPELAGLNDQLNIDLDKSRMKYVTPEQMRIYGGNDGIMTYRLFWILWDILKKDERAMRLFLKLKMPGLAGFQKMEQYGVEIDAEELKRIEVDLDEYLIRTRQELLDMVPKAVIRKQVENKKKLEFSRADFVRDILFSEQGFNLVPIVFTKGTKDADVPTPSTSSKDHLPYFTDADGTPGDFCTKYIEYQKLKKLSTTYVREFMEKYVHVDGRIHPGFTLHVTVTGRSSSRNPNAQNFPSRGEWAKRYKKIFKAREGYKFISADLSQIELRLIAWESRDPVMLDAYRIGKDIHTITAMAVSGHTEASWNALPKDEKKLLRFRAKAVNFGFCYGMRAKKFRRYAKTDYGIDLTDAEAKRYYDTYHNLYKNIKKWHVERTYEAKRQGFVTSLHGAVRHVPSVFSENEMIRMGAERQAINSPIQSFGSDLGVLAIARIARQVNPDIIRPVMFIHDDIVLEVKDSHEEEAVNMLLWVLNNPPLKQLFDIQSPIPILAEPDIGHNLGEMYELYDLSKDAPEEYKKLATLIKPAKPNYWVDSIDLT